MGKKLVKKKPKISTLRNKADRLLQEWGRRKYAKYGCLICGGTYNCLHHYYTKGSSNALRYDEDNLIPICLRCHYRHHHTDDPSIHDRIRDIMGDKWLNTLRRKKNKVIKSNRAFYEEALQKYAKQD